MAVRFIGRGELYDFGKVPLLKGGYLAVIFAFWLACPKLYADMDPLSLNQATREQVDLVLRKLPAGYDAHTQHFDAKARPIYSNRLLLEDSPYLQQHAHQPVNWLPWGSQAFEIARQTQRPIFLSIGYASCHWCHVMAQESFDDLEVAELLNTYFVPIKVDREQLPAIDAYYMSGLQLLTGAGGWPLSGFLTPDQQLFHAGTYFSKPAFMDLLESVRTAWQQQRGALQAQAEKLSLAIRELHRQIPGDALHADAFTQATAALLKQVDVQHGGFGQGQKFPSEIQLSYLMDNFRRGENQLGAFLKQSLTAMASGGLFDHIGGGFHRYTVDRAWKVPHFEKMLTTQALLASLYTDAYMALNNRYFARVAQQCLDFVIREMSSPTGQFYSGLDADSEDGEGAFYLWSAAELDQSLTKAQAALAKTSFFAGNPGQVHGQTVLHLALTADESAATVSNERWDELDSLILAMRKLRASRSAPRLDKKIITAWNAMTIAALAKAARVFKRADYGDAAVVAMTQLQSSNRNTLGEWQRSSYQGESSIAATLSDYAWLSLAQLALYDTTQEISWLDASTETVDALLEAFWDSQAGGFFDEQPGANSNAPDRLKRVSDSGDEPASNAVALEALIQLQQRTGALRLKKPTRHMMRAYSGSIGKNPGAYSGFLRAAAMQRFGSANDLQYGAAGKLRAYAQRQGESLTLNIVMRPEWHVNAHQATSDNLIGLKVSGESLLAVDYPEAVLYQAAFVPEAIAVYSGEFLVQTKLAANSNRPISLSFQACSESLCLEPERLVFPVSTEAAP